MYKFLNILMSLLVVFFIASVSNFYFSNKNISLKDYNRSNIDLILKEKSRDLPILVNDTNDILEFNDSFDEEKNNEKKRSFWELLNKNES
mgnify:CR=1 FL=1|tara:strand:- start:701 stop:970 length:270 start_codon:yes stop_codon:yes gene_type:complete